MRNDNSQTQTSKAFTALLNFYNIGSETTEPRHPQQNPAENRIRTVKVVTNRQMDRAGCPEVLWLKATIYAVYF